MLRVLEYDDYPRGRARFLSMMDRLHRQFPNVRCNVFGIPQEMSRRCYREIERRPYLRLYPHGFVHRKRECRTRAYWRPYLGLLDKLADDPRWGSVFKAPWHGYSGEFIHELHARGFSFAAKALSRFPYPMPAGWMMWNQSDAITAMRAPAYDAHGCLIDETLDDFGRYVEAHPIYKVVPKIKAYQTEISRRNIAKWTESWKRDDTWNWVEDIVRPACLKLHLGCGLHVWDGWVNMDPRAELDSRIVKWDFSQIIPYSECKADIVFTSHVFNYIDETYYENALLDIWRVLRPGGIVRLAEDRTDNGYVWRHPGQRSRGTGEIKSLPTMEKITHAMKRVGFTVYVSGPGETRSPHKDVLQGDSRPMRFRRGHKFYAEGVKDLGAHDISRIRRWDCRAALRGRYLLPPLDVVWHPDCKPNED